jgi:Ca-activated chloride channel homolog
MHHKPRVQSTLIAAVFLAGLLVSNWQRVHAQTQTQPKSTTQTTQKPTTQSTEPEPEVVRVETNLVNTLFTAVDKDRHFITSLRAEDVRIFENEVAQPVSLFEHETDRPLSLAILIDTSRSQVGVLENEKSAARRFVDSVIRPDKDRAAVISFTGVPKVEQELTNDLVRLRKGIERVRIDLPPEKDELSEEEAALLERDPRGYTAIWDAMWMTIEKELARAPENTRRAIILLSDGDDTRSTIKKQDVIDFAIKSDVVIYSIGIRDRDFSEGKMDSGSLRKISDRTGGRAFFPVQPNELQQAFSQIDQELRSQYLIAYSPVNKNRDGSYRRIRIELVNPELRKQKLQLLYREGYYARNN